MPNDNPNSLSASLFMRLRREIHIIDEKKTRMVSLLKTITVVKMKDRAVGYEPIVVVACLPPRPGEDNMPIILPHWSELDAWNRLECWRESGDFFLLFAGIDFFSTVKYLCLLSPNVLL
jgi:hypothetical protein